MSYWYEGEEDYGDYESGSEYSYSGARNLNTEGLQGPLLASTVHPQVRDVLKDDSLVGMVLGKAMIRAIEIQLQLHAQQDVKYRGMIDEKDEDITLPVTRPGSGDGNDNVLPTTSNVPEEQSPPTLFAQAAARVAVELGRSSDEEAQAIAKRVPHVASPVLRSMVWNFVRLPYAVMSQALRLVSAAAITHGTAQVDEPSRGGEGTGTIDEWIIRNEKYMRARLVLDHSFEGGPPASPENDEENPSLSQLGIDTSASHWKEYMVGLGRDAKKVFPSEGDAGGSPSSTVRIQRPKKDDLPGLLLLDHYRQDAIEINTLLAFQTRFDSMTLGALKGLNWDNVIVAGGIALAALTSVTDTEANRYKSSDIDLYLYGLKVEHANAKLQEIEKVFASNLPLDNNTGKPIKYAVVRNLQTITFVPERYPYRRVQVVLKLCPNPMAILLNFDLDQVAIGYTGDEVWMLPRASRALITGYTTFTMDLIHGSFLAPRKATQDQRVFKYGERGYGLRFLPSYIEAVPTVPLDQRTTTGKTVSEASLARDELNVTLREERARVSWFIAQRFGSFIGDPAERSLYMTDMTSRVGVATAEIAEKSSMSGWQLFARHIALWELSQLGYFRLMDQEVKKWASSDYEDDTLSYDDMPDYIWDSEFALDELKDAAVRLQKSDEANLRHCLRHLDPSLLYDSKKSKAAGIKRMALRRNIVASTLKEAFELPIVCAVHVPMNFRAHAEAQLPAHSSRFVSIIPTQREDAASERELAASVVKSKIQPDHPRRDDVVDEDDDYNEDEEEVSEPDEYEDEYDDEDDGGFVLSYWTQGPDSTASDPIQPHWQLVSREHDEIHEVLHAFRRAHRDLRMPVQLRNQSLRRQVSRRLVRPTERSERDAFVRWVLQRAPKSNTWNSSLHLFAMLTASRTTVFRRFEMTLEKLEYPGDLREDMHRRPPEGGSGRYDHADKIKTVEEWIRWIGGIDDHERKACWGTWYRQRIPPVQFLSELSRYRQSKRKRSY